MDDITINYHDAATVTTYVGVGSFVATYSVPVIQNSYSVPVIQNS